METERVIIFGENGEHKQEDRPVGETESQCCEIYETMPAIYSPYNPDFGIMFFDGVQKGWTICGHTNCHGVLICKKQKLYAYGTEAFIGVVCGCVACVGLTLDN